MAIELATAYYTLIPSMAGTAAAVQAGLGTTAVSSAFTKGGNAGGLAMGAGLGAGLGKVIPVLAGAFAAIGVANFFGDAVDAASDLNESANAIRVSFGDAADEIDRLGDTAADRLGLSKTDFNAASVRFSSFAEDLATDGRSVSDVIDQLTTRGADFASVYNIDVADALAIFQSGLSGEAEPLKRFGINLLDSSVSAYAYANGIAEAGTQLDQTQKLQARYGLLLQETAKVQGDFANTSDQLANKQRINAANFEDALAKIGTALLPVATSFAEFIGSDENQARLEKVVDLLIKSGPAIEVVADGLIAISELSFEHLDEILTFFDALEDGTITLTELQDIFSTMPAYAQNAVRAVLTIASGISNSVIDVVNTARNALGTLTGISLPNLPHVNYGSVYSTSGKKLSGLAGGGTLTSAGAVLVGERGPEILNLPRAASVIPLESGDAARAVRVDINNYGVDPQTAAEIISQNLKAKLVTLR